MTKDRDNDDDDNESDDATMIICLLHGVFRCSFSVILFFGSQQHNDQAIRKEKDHCIREMKFGVFSLEHFAQQVFMFA